MNRIILNIIKLRNFYKVSIVLSLLLCSCSNGHNENERLNSLISSNDLVYNSLPATKEDGIPVGNGSFGGLLVASVNTLTWQMNHTGFWRFDPQSKVHPGYGARPFGLGRLTIRWGDTIASQKSNIEQRLSLYDAIFTLKQNPAGISVENFFDMDNDCAVFKLTNTSSKPIAMNIDLEGWRAGVRFFEINSGVGITDTADFARSPEEIEYLQKLTANKYTAPKSTQATGIKLTGCEVKLHSGENKKRTLQFELNSGQEVVLYVGTTVLEGKEKLADPVQKAIDLIEHESKISYSELKSKHVQWWENYWQASYIQIESNDSLAAFAENLWYLHLYQMAIADRGKYPIKFNWGNWIIDNDEREWGGGYWHLNQQYAHLAMQVANHLEFLDNYYNPLFENLELLKATSLELWKHPGAFLHETHSPEGVAYQQNRNSIYTDSTMWTGLIFSTGCEVAFQMYKYALYTGDEKYMEEKVFPFLREVCLFYVYHLKKDEKGMYYIYPSNMHENFWRVKNPMTDLAAIRACFPLLIEMFAKYGGDKVEKEKYMEVLEHLSPYAKGKWIVEGQVDMGGKIVGVDTSVDMFAPAIIVDNNIIHNRHGVDSYTVYPFELTLPGKKDYQTAVNTFNNRFFKPMKWTLQHDMLPAALLGLSDEARNCTADYLSISHMSSSGICPWLEVISTVSYGINLMLIQSHDSVIQLFPACPEDWDVSFKLRAQGPVLVEVRKEKGKIIACSVQCLKTQNITIRNNWNTEVEVYDGQNLITSSKSPQIKWQGIEGKTYILVEKGKKPEKPILPTIREKNEKVKQFRNNQLGVG